MMRTTIRMKNENTQFLSCNSQDKCVVAETGMRNMGPSIIYLLLLIMLKNADADKISANLTRTYYTDRNIHQLVVFNCWHPRGMLSLALFS